MMNGESVIRSLTAARPLKYYIDDEALFGVGDEPAPRWTVQVSYEDTRRAGTSERPSTSMSSRGDGPSPKPTHSFRQASTSSPSHTRSETSSRQSVAGKRW